MINKTTGTSSSGTCYLQNCAQSSTDTVPNDIRFTNSDGTTQLDYWVESSDANTARVSVESDFFGTGTNGFVQTKNGWFLGIVLPAALPVLFIVKDILESNHLTTERIR
jgi:hypothetical protein